MKKLQVQLTDDEACWLEATLFQAREDHVDFGNWDECDPDTVADCTNKVWEAMEQAGWRLSKK